MLAGFVWFPGGEDLQCWMGWSCQIMGVGHNVSKLDIEHGDCAGSCR